MAKDPAFLFYYQDFLVGTSFMTFEEIGAYIKLLCFLADRGSLTEEQILKKIPQEIWNNISNKFIIKNCNVTHKRLQEEVEKRKAYTESRRQSRLKSDEDNVKIYLIKDKTTGYIKIGSSVNPKRIFAEMCNQTNPAITVGKRDYELIFESTVVPRTTEKNIHNLFNNNNIQGEWFKLSEKDIKNIRLTYGNDKRMENENENENKDINVNKDININKYININNKGVVKGKEYLKDPILYLNEKAKRQFDPNNKSTQDLVRARYNEGRTLEQFKIVIDKKVDQWLTDDKMMKYLRPSTLFSRTNFENYLNEPVETERTGINKWINPK